MSDDDYDVSDFGDHYAESDGRGPPDSELEVDETELDAGDTSVDSEGREGLRPQERRLVNEFLDMENWAVDPALAVNWFNEKVRMGGGSTMPPFLGIRTGAVARAEAEGILVDYFADGVVAYDKPLVREWATCLRLTWAQWQRCCTHIREREGWDARAMRDRAQRRHREHSPQVDPGTLGAMRDGPGGEAAAVGGPPAGPVDETGAPMFDVGAPSRPRRIRGHRGRGRHGTGQSTNTQAGSIVDGHRTPGD